MNINEIRYKIDDYISFSLANEESLCFLKNKNIALFDVIEAFAIRKAKRIRPILLMLSFYGYAKKDNPTIIHAAVAVELMHTFALIHDDIIDCSSMRDSIPSLYQAIGNLQSSGKLSCNPEGMAMLIGDLIYNIALNEFQKMKMQDSAKIAGMELLISTALKTGRGQLMEQVQCSIAGILEKEVLAAYDLKTAAYTFCLPLKMGAMLAGKEKKEQKKLDETGLKLGRAFQIIDDINDFDPENEIVCDFLAAMLWKKTDLSEKKRLKEIYASHSGSENDVECLKDLYHKYDIEKCASRIAFEFVDEALGAIDKLAIHTEIKAPMKDYIASIMKFSHS